ncbi:hypothetical protein HPB50_023077 [Hyalomma asiaticum]|uniref:Uncharacterized protein n=1 Tax=Hyalomma asiaticum TaxID=266040 RepID=A0ACB7T4F1_HYAAI|nr:hypothetical protein HPB50_023077 [Hyalomma asiaticum]
MGLAPRRCWLRVGYIFSHYDTSNYRDQPGGVSVKPRETPAFSRSSSSPAPGLHRASCGSQGSACIMAFAAPPPKAHCFVLSAPEGSTVDDVIDALEAVTGPAGIKSLQHMGGVKFGAAAANVRAATKLKSRGNILLNGESVPLVSVGPEIVHVSVFRVPLWVGDAALAAALSAYGNVQSVHEPVFKGRPGVGTGVRVARVEMKKPIPNFLSVQGFNVMCDYWGVQKVCSRCRLAGHIAKDCITPRCARCNVYGHATEGCTEPCRRCSGNHATADCVRPKSFAAAAAGSGVSPPTPASQEQVPALESDSETLTSRAESQAESQDIRDPPPPSCVPSETGDSSSETHEDHGAPRTESPVSVPSSDHASCSSDTGGSSGSSDTPRAPMGRGTRAAGRPEVPLTSPSNSTAVSTQPKMTSSRGSKYSAQTRKMNLSNPLYKITGPVFGACAGDYAMEIDRQATKRVHSPSTDSDGSSDSSKPEKLANALTPSEQFFS